MPDRDLLIAIAVIAALVLIAVRWFVMRLGCDCHKCGKRMKFFRELAPEQKDEILRYFRTHEKRDPDTSAVFFCEHCLNVYDDFSGEKTSMSGDDRSMCKVCNSPSVWYLGDTVVTGEVAEFRAMNAELVKEIECLRCERRPSSSLDCVLCDTSVRVTGCRKCHTLYVWRRFEPSKYKFLVPLTDRAILQRCSDQTLGGI